jgi:hypothetical protein
MRRTIILAVVLLASCTSTNPNDRWTPAPYNMPQRSQTYTPRPVYNPPPQQTVNRNYPRSGGGQCVCGDSSGCPPGVVPACR